MKLEDLPDVLRKQVEDQIEPVDRTKKKAKYSDKKELFLHAWRLLAEEAKQEFGEPEPEAQLIPGRKHHIDWSWPDYRVIVEVDGGNRMVKYSEKLGRNVAVGRHTQDEDYWKINELVSLGWAVLRFTTNQLRDDPVTCMCQTIKTLKLKKNELGPNVTITWKEIE